jgi:hypothetical protein
VSGYYEADGTHRCDCGAATTYQSMSGGSEFYCPSCDDNGLYPEGEGGPRARLLTQPDGKEKLRRIMYDEIARRKAERG